MVRVVYFTIYYPFWGLNCRVGRSLNRALEFRSFSLSFTSKFFCAKTKEQRKRANDGAMACERARAQLWSTVCDFYWIESIQNEPIYLLISESVIRRPNWLTTVTLLMKHKRGFNFNCRRNKTKVIRHWNEDKNILVTYTFGICILSTSLCLLQSGQERERDEFRCVLPGDMLDFECSPPDVGVLLPSSLPPW
jgi:hypothetical protein